MKKRLVSFLLAFSMMLTILPTGVITAFADSENTPPLSGDCGKNGNNLTWNLILNNNNAENPTYTLSIQGTGEMKSYSGSNADKSLQSPWIANCEKITAVQIGTDVSSIGSNAFYNCTNLTEITIPDNINSIEHSAFYNCSSLTKITLPSALKEISSFTFYGCTNLNSIEIPKTVTSIGNDAFDGCQSLTSLDLPNLTVLSRFIFNKCSGLKSITIPSSVTTIQEGAFYGCSNLTALSIPDSVVQIDKTAFGECSSLSSINIPSKITSIASYTFGGCRSLSQLQIPESVTSIGAQAFWKCSSLTSLHLPSKITKIEDFTFFSCLALKEINIPTGVTSIGKGAFQGCTVLDNIQLSEGVSSIRDYAFCNCNSLSNLDIPDKVTIIGEASFSGCKSLTNIKLPSGVTAIKDRAFENCSGATNIQLSPVLNSIGNMAFVSCQKADIIIPDSVESIGERAFEYCKSVTLSKTLPNKASVSEKAYLRISSRKLYYPGHYADWLAQVSKMPSLSEADNTVVSYQGEDYPVYLYPICYLCDVTFNANGGAFADGASTKTIADIYRTENIPADKVPSNPERYAYTFAGWCTDPDNPAATMVDDPSSIPQTSSNPYGGVYDQMTLYAVWSPVNVNITAPSGITVQLDADAPVTSSGTPMVVHQGKTVTLTIPDSMYSSEDDYNWIIGGQIVGTGRSYQFTAVTDTVIDVDILKALHFNENGTPKTEGTKKDESSGTYYGNGWNYIENQTLKITGDQVLSAEPAIRVPVEVASGVTVSNAAFAGQRVSNYGTLNSCVLDAAATGRFEESTGSITNSLFGADPDLTDTKELTEADHKTFTIQLNDVKDGSLTGERLWFIGSPALTATVDDGTEIKHINHITVSAASIDGLTGSVTKTDRSVSFIPNGEMDILLNNRTVVVGDFTFTVPDDCDYDGLVHKVEDICSETYDESEYTVWYDYIKPDGTTGSATTEPVEAGTYTVKIIMADKQVITPDLSFTIRQIGPTKEDFTESLPVGITEDKNDSEKEATAELKEDSLFRKAETDGSVTVAYTYVKVNSDGTEEIVAAPTAKGSYKLVATVTVDESNSNLLSGKVEWNFSILDRMETFWPVLTIKDGTLIKAELPGELISAGVDEAYVLSTGADNCSGRTYHIPAGTVVTLSANAASEGMVFDQWTLNDDALMGDPNVAYKQEALTFTMPDHDLKAEVMYRDATIEDDGPGIWGTGALVATAFVGAATLGYQAHMLGTEFALRYRMPEWAVIPRNRMELAVMMWQDADQPEPAENILYADIDEDDTDAQKAARWAVENDLIELLDAENAPDHFDPYALVTYLDSIHAWDKAQELKKV